MKYGKTLRLVGLALLLTALTGCDSWKSDTDFAHAVWSDDDTKVAFVKRSFKKKKNFTHYITKDYSLELFVANSDGTDAIQLAGKRIGSVKDIFFMNEAGYIILGRGLAASESSGTQSQTIIYEKISLDGTVEQIGKVTGNIMVSCDGGSSSTGTTPPLRVIPSRDGETLAMVESVTECASNEMTLTFLDAETLEPISDTMDVDTEMIGEGGGNGIAYLSFLTMSWTPEGAFVVSKAFGMGELLVGLKFEVDGVQGEWVDSLTMDCMQVATSSGATSTDGTEVNIEDDGTLSFGANDMFLGCH